MENLKYIPFNQVNFSDAFFDSLKADYSMVLLNGSMLIF
jgi:hypothetical protein